jgi:hypothetical protein
MIIALECLCVEEFCKDFVAVQLEMLLKAGKIIDDLVWLKAGQAFGVVELRSIGIQL